MNGITEIAAVATAKNVAMLVDAFYLFIAVMVIRDVVKVIAFLVRK